jgi:hypothetical protein
MQQIASEVEVTSNKSGQLNVIRLLAPKIGRLNSCPEGNSFFWGIGSPQQAAVTVSVPLMGGGNLTSPPTLLLSCLSLFKKILLSGNKNSYGFTDVKNINK